MISSRQDVIDFMKDQPRYSHLQASDRHSCQFGSSRYRLVLQKGESEFLLRDLRDVSIYHRDIAPVGHGRDEYIAVLKNAQSQLTAHLERRNLSAAIAALPNKPIIKMKM